MSGSRGTDDPTMATLPFVAAKAAKEQGHDVVLWLWNEAVTLGRKSADDHVTGGNLTPLKDLLADGQRSAVVCQGLSMGSDQWREKKLNTCVLRKHVVYE
ncbi:MAG: DsrE family protein [Nitrospirota bacterium]